MKKRKPGSRHRLLIYWRFLNRIWKITFVLGAVLAFAWGWIYWETQTISLFSTDTLILAGAVVAFLLTLFFFLARSMAYVQPYQQFLKFVTPFLRLNISYRRMRSVRPMLVQQIFPRDEISRSQHRALEPFYGKTAIVMELKSYPISPALLRVFLPPALFSPQFTGMVLIVPDWMQLSTEVETFRGSQRRSIKDQAWMDSPDRW